MDDLLEEIAAEGWLVSTICQHDDGTWVCNLRKLAEGGDWITEWARGATGQIALETAMTKIGEAEFHAQREQTFSSGEARPLLNATTILAQLGAKPKAVVRRRI